MNFKKNNIKTKVVLSILSIFIILLIIEVALRMLNLPPELDKNFQRKDLYWTEKNVVLNSSGYRDIEYKEDRSSDVFRIFALGDSYTYGWLIDNPKDTFLEILEENLNNKYESIKKIEVINAASPGFSLQEMTKRFISEGKRYYPDLVIVGINDDEANFSKTYTQPGDAKLNKFIKSLHLYQITLGNFFKYKAEKANHDYVLKIYTDPNSEEWKKFFDQLILLNEEVKKIHSNLIIVLFPHIHPNKPDNPYDYYPFNEKFEQFGKDNNIVILDPLEEFLNYQKKEKLVINPLDPHPTPQMNQLVAKAILSQFNFNELIALNKQFIPESKKIVISSDNLNIGNFNLIKEVSSNTTLPIVYFETKNGSSAQDFPLKDLSSRNTKIYIDTLKTAKSYTHSGLPGATISYYIYPLKTGEISLKKEIYGFEIIGIKQIYALNIEDNGTISSDYIDPKSIQILENEIKISFVPAENYHVFRLNLDVASIQLDISQDGKIENINKTYQLKTRLNRNSDEVSLPFNSKISSWQEFTPDQGINKSIAFVDGKMTIIESLTINKGEIKLKFLKPVSKGQEVTFNISGQYDLEENETIIIETN